MNYVNYPDTALTGLSKLAGILLLLRFAVLIRNCNQRSFEAITSEGDEESKSSNIQDTSILIEKKIRSPITREEFR
jgi:hypothetical protein